MLRNLMLVYKFPFHVGSGHETPCQPMSCVALGTKPCAVSSLGYLAPSSCKTMGSVVGSGRVWEIAYLTTISSW